MRVTSLLADVGGTNVRFALADAGAAQPLLSSSIREFAVAAFPTFVDAAHHYLDTAGITAGHVGTAVFAVAGRIEGDEARITNHPWLISRPQCLRSLRLARIDMINDFAAQARCMPLLSATDTTVIGSAAWRPLPLDAPRTQAVLGPGTGLGVSGLLVRDGRGIALQTEGGHVAFAPTTTEEIAILQRLMHRFGRVSNERLISGSGLVNLREALAEIHGQTSEPLQPADVTARADAGDALSQQAIDHFCAILGAIAGDLVLTLGAWDGVFLAGGLVPRLLPNLRKPAFRGRFEAKGRFADAMARVPSVAVLHPHAGLLGAAAYAREAIAGSDGGGQTA